VTQPSHLALLPHAPQSVQVSSTSVSNKGHFTIADETVLRPYHASHCSVMSQTSHVAYPPYVPHPVLVWLKSCSKKGHFTEDVERVFRSYLAWHWSGLTQISHVSISSHVPQPVQVWSKSGSKKRQFTLEAETGFSISPCIASGWLKYLKWQFNAMRHNQCTFGRNRAVIKGTFSYGRNIFSWLTHNALQRGDWSITCGTLS
jgi:hypothetical protein